MIPGVQRAGRTNLAGESVALCRGVQQSDHCNFIEYSRLAGWRVCDR